MFEKSKATVELGDQVMENEGKEDYVLFYLNRFQIPWYGLLAEKLREATGYKSTLWVNSTDDFDFASSMGKFTEVVNVPQGYRDKLRTSDYADNLSFLRRFENQYGGASYNNAVAIDRRIRAGEWDAEGTAAYAVQVIQTMEKYLELHDKPILAFGENNNLPFRLAHHLLEPVPYLVHSTARHWDDRFFWNEDQTFQWPECIQIYTGYLEDEIPKYIATEATRILESIRTDGSQPFYLVKRPSDDSMPNKSGRIRQWYSREFRSTPRKFVGSLVNYARRQARIRYLNLSTIQNPPKRINFATFFLHHEPEYVVDGAAFPFRDQLNVVENVASYLPADIILLVKEHKPSMGRRRLPFYQRIQRLPNVHLVTASVSSHKFIKNSKIVFTLSGTAALESMYCNTPAIIFGDMFFKNFRGIRRVESIEELRTAIPEVLAMERQATERDRVAAIGAMYSASHKGKIGPQFSLEEISDPENINNIMNSLKPFLANSHEKIVQ